MNTSNAIHPDPLTAAQTYLASLPQRQPDCPLEPDLMDLALGLETELTAQQLDHVHACPYCSRAVTSYWAKAQRTERTSATAPTSEDAA